MSLLQPPKEMPPIAQSVAPELSFALSLVTGLAALTAIGLIKHEEEAHWARKLATWKARR